MILKSAKCSVWPECKLKKSNVPLPDVFNHSITKPSSSSHARARMNELDSSAIIETCDSTGSGVFSDEGSLENPPDLVIY